MRLVLLGWRPMSTDMLYRCRRSGRGNRFYAVRVTVMLGTLAAKTHVLFTAYHLCCIPALLVAAQLYVEAAILVLLEGDIVPFTSAMQGDLLAFACSATATRL